VLFCSGIELGCFFFKRDLSVIFLILRRPEQYIIIIVHKSSCKVLVILVIFQLNINLLVIFSKNIHILNFMKIPVVFFHADGRTEIDRQDELMVALCNFSERP
jgi:hypothetical protein